MGKGVSEPKRKYTRRKGSAVAPPAAFVELLTSASHVAASCIIEVESHRGTLRARASVDAVELPRDIGTARNTHCGIK